MARFSDIPAELILDIIAFVQLEDLENFAQSCQRCQIIASPALKKHRLLIRQYSTIKDVEARTISKTLKQVLMNPQTGRYIRNITLNHVRDPKWFSYNAGYSVEDLQLFVAASRNSSFLSPPGEAPLSYRSVIERGDEDILLAILLPLLPNLTSLSLPRVDNGRHSCWTSDLLSYVPHASTPTLAKLSTVCIKGEYPHLSEAVMYASLPSMKSLSVLSVSTCGYDDAHVFGQGQKFSSSYITNLELWECKMPSRHLQNFLLGCHCLQSFAYSCGIGGDPNTRSAYYIRQALLNKAKSTLRKLTILGCSGHTTCVMGTLRPFEVLEEVCTDWELLVSLSLNRAEPMPLRIMKSFPASLRKLRLNDEIGRAIEHHSQLVESVVRAQKWGTHVEDPAVVGLQLQELTITIESHVRMPEPTTFHVTDNWYSECEKVGITLDHFVKKTEKTEKLVKPHQGFIDWSDIAGGNE